MRKNRQKKYNLYKIKAYETCKGNGNKNGKTKINFTNEIFFFCHCKNDSPYSLGMVFLSKFKF